MTTKNITGNVIDGNYIDAPRRSCKPVDYPTEERVDVAIDGTWYNRAVYRRVIWRAMGEDTLVAEFVIVNGTNYEVAEVEADEDGWHEAGNLGEIQDVDGNALVYGEYGPDTWGLFTDLDGAEHEFCIRAEGRADAKREANALLAKLAGGWRPLNW